VTLLADLMPCRAILLHFYDMERRDFLIVDGAGESYEDALLGRVNPGDPLLSVVMPREDAFSWNDLSAAPVAKLDRLARIGGALRVMSAPVKSGERYLGAIELVDPKDGMPFREFHEFALMYVARRYADFLVAHGVIVEVELVARHALKG